jgi:tRNA G46 methylase TrmB
VLQAARRDPRGVAIGVDAEATRLHDAAHRARKQRLANAVFVVGDAAQSLSLLSGRIDELRITLPWGSLLRWAIEGEQAFAEAVAGAL